MVTPDAGLFVVLGFVVAILTAVHFLFRDKPGQAKLREARRAAKDAAALSDANVASVAAQRAEIAHAAERARLTRELEFARTGDLVPLDQLEVVLQKGEIAYASSNAQLFEVRVTGYKGKTSGFSFHVAKGVTFRTGAIRGHAERDLVPVAKGKLVVTNQRVIFNGDAKSVTLRHKSIVGVQALSDGLQISDSRHTVYFLTGDSHMDEMFKIASQRLIRDGAAR